MQVRVLKKENQQDTSEVLFRYKVPIVFWTHIPQLPKISPLYARGPCKLEGSPVGRERGDNVSLTVCSNTARQN